MLDLRVIGAEEGKLVAISNDGQRFHVSIDEGLRSALRTGQGETKERSRVSPREIQSQIRAGLSAEEVSAATGLSLEDVRKFEGPILAEREYVITTAREVAVNTVLGAELGEQPDTFGAAIESRLQQLNATSIRWASWKEETSGWTIKLTFTANQIDHDARWRFDPRKLALSPLNGDAENLSRQGDLSGTLIPRLRAVDGNELKADQSRFDSGAFTEHDLDLPVESSAKALSQDTEPQLERVPYGRIGTRPVSPGIEASRGNSQTADLLEALRKRRGEREVAVYGDDDASEMTSKTTGIRLVEVPLPESDEDHFEDELIEPPSAPKASKRGRASVPSWDEIVFGARSDDDPA